MPMPVGGAFALRRRASGAHVGPPFDPDLEEFRRIERHIQNSLTCSIEFSRGVIPPNKGKISGIMVLEAQEDIEHTGLFIMLKGLPIPEKKKKPQPQQQQQQSQQYHQQYHQPAPKPLTEIRFTVLESDRDHVFQIDGRSKESYPVELDIPEELPPPLLTSRGRLIYRMYVCVDSTLKRRHVVVGETSLRWQGYKKLEKEEMNKELKIEQHVHSKRALLGLGWRKSALMEWRVEKGGYLPGEQVRVELWGECKDKDGLQLEGEVKLVQKVWYQVPSGIRGVQMWTKMKVNVLATGVTEEVIEVKDEDEEGEDGETKKLLWQGTLQVPKRITPTIRFDFMNSVSYTIRAKIGVVADGGEDWVTGEVPLLIGNCKERDEDDELDGGEEDEEDEEDDDFDSGSPSPSPRSPTSPADAEKGINRPRSGSSGAALDTARRSRSMSLIPNFVRPRAGSFSIVDSLASSTLSIFRMPPSYSQLSSRKPTMETLPPAYSETLDAHEHIVPLIVLNQQTDENMENPDMVQLELKDPQGSGEDPTKENN